MASGPALRVMTYNLHGLADDRAALVRVVRGQAPDLLMLQEAAGRLRTRSRVARLARLFGMMVGAGGLDSVGNVILTSMRVRVHQAWALRYPLIPGRHLRGAAFARCSVARTPFVAAASHLSTDPAERPGQARRLAAALAGLDLPVVFAGDLNDTPGGTAWCVLAEGRVDAGAARPAATFPTRGADRRIDAIMADPVWRILDCRVVDTPDSRRASDHFPVVADLVLPG
jgi:endonuclease/exonuclease/phosphatase family metal-dependent hydrolase